MIVFQVDSIDKTMYQYIKDWMNEKYGVKTEAFERTEADPEAGKILVSNSSGMGIFHEAMHMWLFKASCGMTNHEDNAEHNRLSNTTSSIFELEQGLLTRECQSAMENIFGVPLQYFDVYLNRSPKHDYEKEMGMRGFSYIGNLVDETSTLGWKDNGHPMTNFHEFFASSMTTMAFGDIGPSLEKLARLGDELKNFRISADEAEKLRDIYSQTKDALKNVYDYGKALVSDFDKYGKGPSEIENLKNNLQKLENYLIKEGLVLESARKQKL